MDRRSFIRTTTGIAFGSIVVPSPVAAWHTLADTARIVVFHEPSFPCVRGLGCDRALIEQALGGLDVVFAPADAMEEELLRKTANVLVMPYGSAFPKTVWPVIERFLKGGGCLVNLGGVPFAVPVARDGASWSAEVPQTAYHKKLGITQSFPVSSDAIVKYASIENRDSLSALPEWLRAAEVYALYFRLAETTDIPSESGSAGTRDATIRPLVLGYSQDGTGIAAPVVCIDRLIGDHAGGRWIIAGFSGSLKPEGIRALVEYAAEGAFELVTRPSYACYYEGEIPSFTIQFRRQGATRQHDGDPDCTIEIAASGGNVIDKQRSRLRGDATLMSTIIAMRRGRSASLSPGMYRVRTTLSYRHGSGLNTIEVTHSTGFWVYDAKLLAGGEPFAVDRYHLLRDGKTFPVTGTTYMGSDVHRKFLFEPNAWLWDRDFSEMKDTGINMVRTGIWTAWRSYMLDPGVVNESILRSLDAFILTAKKHDIPVIFTFFAFLPESWGGENAYLDPRSVTAQKEFIAAIVRRYPATVDIIWDLINEPSFCSPQNLWSCRPNYDRFESSAWLTWLRKRYPSPDDEALRLRLQRLYRCAGSDALRLPSMDDFAGVNIIGDRMPLKVVDYRLFAQDMFTEWAAHLAAHIRRHGNPRQLVTVGQDEAGTNDSPNPQFHAHAVDFTCLHNWWLNDDLLWDSIVTKSPLKPNLVEETGIMFYEKLDGTAWRTEEDAAHLLERKLAISLVAGGAGYIQWIWNTNPFMKSDNEAAIGLLRADGTAKPEMRVMKEMSEFVASCARWMSGRRDEDVLLVLPHSQMFSPRNHATEATKRAVRAMCYGNRIPLRAVSEYGLDDIGPKPKLVVVPSPVMLSSVAWNRLIDLATSGSIILITGPCDEDEHRLPEPRMTGFGYRAPTSPVAQEEVLIIDGRPVSLSYRGERMHRIEKANVETQSIPEVVTVPVGAGLLIWSPLPVELSEQTGPAIRLYQYALDRAKIAPVYRLDPADSPLLVYASSYERSTLYSLISESAIDTSVTLTETASGRTHAVKVKSQRTVMIMVNQEDGSVIAKRG